MRKSQKPFFSNNTASSHNENYIKNCLGEYYQYYVYIKINKKLPEPIPSAFDTFPLFPFFLSFKKTPLYFLRDDQNTLNNIFQQLNEGDYFEYSSNEASIIGWLNQRNTIERLLKEEEYEDARIAFCALCFCGYTESVESILKNPKIKLPKDAYVAIVEASQNGHYEIVQLLLEDERVIPSKYIYSAICRAYENGYIEVAQLLLKKFRLDSDSYVISILYNACKIGYFDMVCLLLKDTKTKPDDIRMVIKSLESPLKFKYRDKKIFDLLRACAATDELALNNPNQLLKFIQDNFSNKTTGWVWDFSLLKTIYSSSVNSIDIVSPRVLMGIISQRYKDLGIKNATTKENHLSIDKHISIFSRYSSGVDVLSCLQTNKKAGELGRTTEIQEIFKEKVRKEFPGEYKDMLQEHEKSENKEAINYKKAFIRFQHIKQSLDDKYPFYLDILKHQGFKEGKKISSNDLDMLYLSDSSGIKNTPLYWLCMKQKILDTLFKQIQTSPMKKTKPWKIAKLAALFNQTDIIEYYLNKTDYFDPRGVMYNLCRIGHTALVKKLLTDSRFHNSWLAKRPFHSAIRLGHLKIVELFLMHTHFSVHYEDVNMAIIKGHQKIANTLDACLLLQDIKNSKPDIFLKFLQANISNTEKNGKLIVNGKLIAQVTTSMR